MPRSKKSAAEASYEASLDQISVASVADPNASAGDQDICEFQPDNVASLAPIISEIRYWHRQRVFAMDQRKRADLALGAFLRTQLGWSRSLPKAEGAKIAKRASDLVALGEKVAKGKTTGIGDSTFGQWSPVILASIQGRGHWDAIEAAATKEMERLASSLPVWTDFGEAVKGFGARSLAVIIGEAGDIGSYATVAKLWKRMGLAVMDGVRQGGLRKTASADEWIAHGYNAKRRSYMFVIGDVLVKNKSAYRDVYLERKQYERDRAVSIGLTVAPAAKIPAARKHEFMSDGHIHKRAQRYMEKRLLKHLWQAWRRTILRLESNYLASAATSSAQAERSADAAMPSTQALPSASTRQTRDRVNPIATSSGKRRTSRRESTTLEPSAARPAIAPPTSNQTAPDASSFSSLRVSGNTKQKDPQAH